MALHLNQKNVSPQHRISHKKQHHIDLLLQIYQHVQVVNKQKYVQPDHSLVWNWLLFWLSFIQSYRSVNPEKYKPSDHNDCQTPVKIYRVSPVYWYPTQKQKHQNVVHELHHVNVVKLTKSCAFNHNLFNVVLGAHCVLYPHPFICTFFLVYLWIVRCLFSKSNCYDFFRIKDRLLIWL